MLSRWFNRPEPETECQPYALEHIQEMGRGVSKRILSNDAYGAFFTLAASRVRIADAYTHGDPKHGGQWVLELHGAYEWQECRWSPEQWQAFYEAYLQECDEAGKVDGALWLGICRNLAREYPNGQLASLFDNVEQENRYLRGEVDA